MNSENIFGQRIFELRKSAGMTQKQLGEAVGLSMQAVNDIEKGRRETTITKAILLARMFNTTVEYLVGDTDDPARPFTPCLPQE
jgi:transcriptional regulator, cro/CI